MKIAIVCCAILVALCVQVNALGLHQKLHKTQKHFSDIMESRSISVSDAQNFTQRLSHFDEQDKRTWTQRYVINDQFWDGTGPIFFLINGEGPLDLHSVSAGGYQYMIWAEQFNALAVSLEHRFYGESQPLPDLSTDNLQYLNAELALADAAYFISWIKESNNAQDNMVITFGGSYAGMLSGWMRQKYPNLIDASIASSGPVNAQVDFYQYLEVVSASLVTLGSQQCVDNIATAVQKLQSIAATGSSGWATLSQMFDTCEPIASDLDLANFFQFVAGNFMGVVQYNLEMPGVNITTLCDMMTATSDSVSNLLNLWQFFTQDECVDVSYDDMVEELKNTTINDAVGGRQWFYQTCVEFGYFQTSDSSNQPFGNLFNVSTQTLQCTDVFGFDYLPDVQWTISEFGGTEPDGSNTLWVNGLIDPWHALGVLTVPTDADYTNLIIEGTAHCADMIPAQDYSPPTLAPAQAQIGAKLTEFISAFNPNTKHHHNN